MPFVDIDKMTLEQRIKRLIGVVVFKHLPPPDDFGNRVGRQKPAVFTKKDKNQAVEELLRFAK